MHRYKSALRNRLSRKRRAFTLAEMLIVLVLIMMVGGIALTQLGDVLNTGEEKIESIKVKDSFNLPLLKYRTDTGTYPSTEQGLSALLVAPEDSADRWKGPYLKGNSALLDSWKRPYQYACPGAHNPRGYDVWTTGPDGQSGTADDIGNWE